MLDNFRKVGIVWNHSTNQIYQRMRVASSDDHGRKLVVQITNDYVLENTSKVELRLYWEIRDKKGFNDFTLIDAEHGIYEIYFSRGMLENKGTHKAWLHAIDTTGSITSEVFGIEVFKGIELEALEGTEDFSALNSALGRVVEIETQEQKRVDNEKLRETAESARKAAETTRDTNETARKTAETNRVNAENTRDTNETARKTAETNRVTKENIRESNEVIRQKRYNELKDLDVTKLEDDVEDVRTEMLNAAYLANEGQENIDFKIETNDVPVYWRSHIQSKIDNINTIHKNGGRDVSSIAFITDIHYERSAGHYGKLLNEISRKSDIHHIINNGDMLSKRVTKKEFLELMREAQRKFGTLLNKTYFSMGNHDDNPYHTNDDGNWDKLVNDKEQFSEYFRYLGNNVTMGSSGKYYYVDDHNFKIRIIILDSIDIPYIKSGNVGKYRGQNMWAYREEQLDWFGNTALNVPDNSWHVLVASHMPPYATGVEGFGGTTRNADMARKILQAFKNKTSYSGSSASNVESDLKATVSVNFSGKGGNVIGWFSGHVHYDNMVDMPEGIKLITTLCDGWEPWADAPTKTMGTTTEHAFDILSINTNLKRVNLTRVGAGSNRTFNY